MTRIDELTEQELAELLREAKEAHAAYERDLGEPHEDWPSWYAAFVLRRLRERA